MSAPATLQRDDIRIFLPDIGEEELAKRAKLRSLRNAATAMIANTDSDNARSLAWMASQYVTGALYAPGAAELLDDLAKVCTRLMLTAIQAEQIDLEWYAP